MGQDHVFAAMSAHARRAPPSGRQIETEHEGREPMVYSIFGKTTHIYAAYLKPLDGDFRKIAYEDTTPEPVTWAGQFRVGEPHCGRRIRREHIPTKLHWPGPWKDFHCLTVIRKHLLICEKLKEIIESLEPNKHQFFPATALNRTKTRSASRYFLNICNRLDTVSREQSTAEFNSIFWKGEKDEIVFDLRKIGDAHIWIDKHLSSGIYVSSALRDECIKQNITGIAFDARKHT